MMTSIDSITTPDRPGIDRPGIDFAGTCDLAIWCKLLHDKGWSGPRIARAIAKSEGYVNNLIRVVERASPSVLLRWRAEQNGGVDHVCATDWLIAVCLSSHERQDEELQRRIAARASLRSGAEGLAGEAANALNGANAAANDVGDPAGCEVANDRLDDKLDDRASAALGSSDRGHASGVL